MPFFSVVIPVFNKEKFILYTLKSVLNQSFIDFEILVINDGSTDDSIKKIAALNDSRITIFSQQNAGAASARNLGIQKANGKLIAFLDADDIWFENHLQELFRLQQDYPTCGMYCSRYFMKISDQKRIKISYNYSINDNYRGIVPDYFDASMINRVGLTSALAIPREILKNNLLFNPKVSSGQDLELFTKIAIQYPIAITNLYTVEYNFSIENQLSKTSITHKKLLNLEQFNEVEKRNVSLKRFLDNYRKEYAIHYKIANDCTKSKALYDKIDPENISFFYKILYFLPRKVLVLLLNLKRYMRKKGFDFRIYN